MGIFTKGINKGAYRGKLTCPYTYYVWDDKTKTGEVVACGSSSQRFVEQLSPTRIRYRCRKCGGTYQYDISNIADNPYALYRKGRIWRDIMRVTGGRKLKGGIQL